MPKDSSWSYTLVNSDSTRSTLLAQMPGEGNRRHYHDNWDEWWLIIKGEWEFEYDNKLLNASKGDLIYLKRNTIHKIKAIGEHLSVRMAVSRDDVEHIYLEKDGNPHQEMCQKSQRNFWSIKPSNLIVVNQTYTYRP